MTHTKMFSVVIGALTVGMLVAGATLHGRDTTHAASPAQRLQRGQYLVHGVGMCIDCHSPRDEKGAFVAGRELTGAALPFAPAVPMPWAPSAPPIAGLPAGYTAETAVHFLMTGERPNGLPPPRPPMPGYRMSRDDAEAIVAYLQSLPRQLQ